MALVGGVVGRAGNGADVGARGGHANASNAVPANSSGDEPQWWTSSGVERQNVVGLPRERGPPAAESHHQDGEVHLEVGRSLGGTVGQGGAGGGGGAVESLYADIEGFDGPAPLMGLLRRCLHLERLGRRRLCSVLVALPNFVSTGIFFSLFASSTSMLLLKALLQKSK